MTLIADFKAISNEKQAWILLALYKSTGWLF